MGPSLAGLAKRASDQAGGARRIIGAARFSSPGSREAIEKLGVETAACDLLDREALARLPECPNVIFMTGHKFGTSENQPITWATNTYLTGIAAERFRNPRIVAFSSGNVYPLTKVASGGPDENHPTGPVGEYAMSALGRERMLGYFSDRNQTPVTILRLNYAIDLRYGVLRDIGEKVFNRQPVPLAMGYANVIWQRDANSIALRAFARCSVPPFVLNLTGPETISVRDMAGQFGRAFGVEPILEGHESDNALLSNAALCTKMFGRPSATVEQMIGWIAAWIIQGGDCLNKPTHFEQRDGAF
jgi:nucleoside-diphosphate-sugar epimerase